jgi:capsular polysaccharide biosynthesis protein
MRHEVLACQARGLAIIPDLPVAMAKGLVRGTRWQVAPAASGAAATPLVAGTESFADDALVAWHRGPQEGQRRDVACYNVSDVVVAGVGQVWVDGHIVTSPEIMPPYVTQALAIAEGGAPALHHCASLPKRTIASPCLVAIGAGTETYGHFLVEMLFRILVARKAWPAKGRLPYKLLLDTATPDWLFRILADDLNIGPDDIEVFQPWREQVLLRKAILPSRVFQDHLIHPFANDLIEELMASLCVPERPGPPQRIFVARGTYHTPEGSRRICVNERELIDLVLGRYGFAAVQPESLNWREQIALFRHASIVFGLTGSGLHNALFSRRGSRVGSIGLINFVQSEIGALRAQRNAYLTKDVKPLDEFTVDTAMFEEFVQVICD